MNSPPLATMFVFAGNNGSGKSTIRNLIVDRIGVSINIDADALARAIDAEHPERYKVSAGKKQLRLQEIVFVTNGIFQSKPPWQAVTSFVKCGKRRIKALRL